MRRKITAPQSSLAAAIALVAATAGAPQLAQAESFGLEEVIVTAQKRAENAQDIPVALTAVQAETLENMGVQNFKDLTKVSSSLTISEGSQKNNSPISLRGIGTFAYSMGVESSVAVIIDDVPVARAGQAFSNLVDIERVEVLRGPQSTLFGKSASAGVISITTKAPSDVTEGTLALVADEGETRASGSVSGMLTDTLGARVSGYYSDTEGHIKNLADGSMLNGGINRGGRAKLVWDAASNLTVSFIGDYNESDEVCCAGPFSYVDEDAALAGFLPQSEWLTGITPSKDNTEVSYGRTPRSKSRDWSATLKLEYDLGDFSLTSITGYRDWSYYFEQDADQTDAFDLYQLSNNVSEALTQELRLTSPDGENLEYILGLYYSKVENSRDFTRLPFFAATWEGNADTESYAVFGQGKYSFSDDWQLIGGLRYNAEEISARFEKSFPEQVSLEGSDMDEVVTGKLALQCFASENVMLFGGYSRGYKGQGYDLSSSFSQDGADNPVAPENSDAFELGIKSNLFDNRLQLNAVLFTTEYEDFQAQSTVQDEVTQTFDFKLNNVGNLKTSGLELDVIALPTENFKVNLGLAYIDAVIEEFKGADCYALQTEALGCIDGKQDLSGKDLSNAPDLKVTLAGEYTLPLQSMPFDGFFNFSYQWQDDVSLNLMGNPDLMQEAYGIVNISMGVDSKEGGYRATLFVNNLLDESYISAASSYEAIFGGKDVRSHTTPRNAERYAGVRLKMNF